MHLRSNIVLKFFALFLFTLEFLAPAVITGLAPNEIATDKAVLVDASNLHNPFYSIFFDELCGNGEGREFDKDSSLHDQFIFGCYISPFESEQIGSNSFANSLLQFNTHPPLYQVQCKLLI